MLVSSQYVTALLGDDPPPESASNANQTASNSTIAGEDGTEHVLLSLINEADGIAMRTLDKLRVNIPKLRHLILTYIEEQQEDILKPPSNHITKSACKRTMLSKFKCKRQNFSDCKNLTNI